MTTTRQDEVAAQTRIRHAMLVNGYTPLANKDKMCTLKRWSKIEVDAALVDEWADDGYRATGVRLSDGLVMIDFDIDDAAMIGDVIDHAVTLAAEYGPDAVARVEALRDAAPVRFGRGEKEAWFARLADGEDGFVRFASTAHCRVGQDPEGADVTLHRLEVFNGSGRQAGVYGAHTLDAGAVTTAYRWLDGVGLADIPLAELPVVMTRDIEVLVAAASDVMSARGWPRHLRSKSGATAELQTFDLGLDDSVIFDTIHGSVDLDGLRGLIEGYGALRLSASWLEGEAARNMSRCIADRNPIDGEIAILDTASWISHRPATMDTSSRISVMVEKLKSVGLADVPVAGFVDVSVEAIAGPTGGHGRVAWAQRERVAVTVYGGEVAEAAERTADAMAAHPRFFDYGGAPAVVTRSHIEVMDEHRLALELGNAFRYQKPPKMDENGDPLSDPIKIDPPARMVKQVLSMGHARGLRPLRGVVDVPLIHLDGGVVTENGYDEATGLLVVMPDGSLQRSRDIPALPSRSDMAAALEVLWSPFREFPFVDAAARGGMLAALLTAAIRPVLPTAPAFAFDAPAQGSGKTLLARCVGEMTGNVKLLSPLPVRDEAEVGKIALSVLMDAPRAVIFDNQLGTVDSASLASILTSSVYGGRILGSTRTVQAPTNMVFMLTGNNISLGGDMPRRVISIRIDAKLETPFSRHFDFDPLAVVRSRRVDMTCAALTLIRGTFAMAGAARVGSFEDWDRLVAQTVALVGREDGVGRGLFGDPTQLLISAHEADPVRGELQDVLESLRTQFGTRWFTAREIWEVISTMTAGHKDVSEALEGVMGGDRRLTKRGIGMILQNRAGQRVGGLALEVLRDKKNGNRYKVARDSDDASGGDVIVGRFDAGKNAAQTVAGQTKIN